MYCQQQFIDYYQAIKLNEEHADLREKRRIIIDALKSGLPEDIPNWTYFNQGSYAMHTGVMPPDGNYDIDLGIVFEMDRSAYSALAIKKVICNTLNKGNRSVEIKYPCVRVNYMKQGEVDFHVDLAIYCKEGDQYYLAKADLNSEDDDIIWEIAAPKELIDWVYDRFEGEDRRQFRRVISYFKKWRNLKIGHSNLPSIALTVLAGENFTPNFDPLNSDKPRDLLAFKSLATYMKNKLTWGLLNVNLPVMPYSNLVGKLTDLQKETLRDKLDILITALEAAETETYTHKACCKLEKQLGEEFPVPEPESARQNAQRPVVVAGSSA
jgi:hypothetical protein